MRETKRPLAWVVYMIAIQGKPGGVSAVCEQGEWEVMEQEQPGQYILVRQGIRSEAEAEALARSSSGYAPRERTTVNAKPAPRAAKRSPASNPLLAPKKPSTN